MGTNYIMIIKTGKRRDIADSLQRILTEFGCIIKMRLGLHEAGNSCSDEGLIILQLADDADERKRFETALKELEGITFKALEI